MRFLTLAVGGLALAVVGFGVGRFVEQRSTPPWDLYKTPYERLRAGYVEIPATPLCTGTPTGLIRIQVTQLLNTLNAKKTVKRDVVWFPMANAPGEADSRGEAVLQLLEPSEIRGFPTNLDFSTSLRNGLRLVDPTKYVVVRVVLDQPPTDNESVEFLHPVNKAESAFAIMRSAASNPKLFCGRREIKYELAGGRQRAFVDFGLQSTGAPESGSFGIGLLVRDLHSPFVTPIILDPNFKNQG